MTVTRIVSFEGKLPDKLKAIGEEAFMGTDMSSIAIPEACTAIGSRVFADSPELTWIYIPSSVKSIEFDAFEGSDNVTIYAPEGSCAIQLAKALGISYEIVE